ncbi:MAG: hypothetical protein ICV66_10925 [Chitinophagaceae bacterium]|nr:hypothetical protein [Chitinophagaceae bacterium]
MAYFFWKTGECRLFLVLYAIVMTSYSTHIKATDRLYDEALKEYIQRDELHSIMKKIMDKYEHEWRSEENVFQVNINEIWKPRVLFAANERLRLAEMILPNQNSTFDQKYLIPPVSEYLSLTCFDLLGQKASWLSFDQWLVSEKRKHERNSILSAITEMDYIKKTSLIYSEYQAIYGVKNSFIYFIDNVLDKTHREALFSSIQIEIYNDYPNDILSVAFGTENDKKKYLYSIRNNFTHKAEHNTPNEYLWPNHYDTTGWWRREEIFFKNKNWHYSVHRDYLAILKDTVIFGIYVKMMEMNNSI